MWGQAKKNHLGCGTPPPPPQVRARVNRLPLILDWHYTLLRNLITKPMFPSWYNATNPHKDPSKSVLHRSCSSSQSHSNATHLTCTHCPWRDGEKWHVLNSTQLIYLDIEHNTNKRKINGIGAQACSLNHGSSAGYHVVPIGYMKQHPALNSSAKDIHLKSVRQCSSNTLYRRWLFVNTWDCDIVYLLCDAMLFSYFIPVDSVHYWVFICRRSIINTKYKYK